MKGEGTEKYRPVVTKESRDAEYSTGNTVSITVTTTFDVSGVLDLLGDHFVSYI